MSKKEVKKITLGLVLSWVLGILFLLAGLGAFMELLFSEGIILLIMSAILLPPVNDMFREKMNFELSTGIKIVLLLICFTIFGAITNSNNFSTNTTTQTIVDNTESTQVENQNTEIKEPKEIIYSMNQSIPVDYLVYNVFRAETFTEMGDSAFKKKTNGKFVKVYLAILNNAKETKYLFAPRFYIVDSKGRKYDRLSDDMLYIADPIEFGQDLQPGLVTAGAIVFELPKDAEDLKLIITGDWISLSQVKVALNKIEDIERDTTLIRKEKQTLNNMMNDLN